jgi:hypothetical protein
VAIEHESGDAVQYLVDSQGRRIAAVIPIEAYQALVEMEDWLDARAGERAIAEAESRGEPTISHEEMKRRFGLA